MVLIRYVDFVLVQSIENVVSGLMKASGIKEFGFVGAGPLMTMEIGDTIKMSVAALTLVLLSVHGEILDVR